MTLFPELIEGLFTGNTKQVRTLCEPANSANLSYVVEVDNNKFGDEEGYIAFESPYQVGDKVWLQEAFKVGAWQHDGRIAIDYLASPELCLTPWLTRINNRDGGIIYQWENESLLDVMDSDLTPDEYGDFYWPPGKAPTRIRPAISMPMFASRLWFEITDVRVEELQAMTVADALSTGISPYFYSQKNKRDSYVRGYKNFLSNKPNCFRSPIESYASLWDKHIAQNTPSLAWENDNDLWVWVYEIQRINRPV